MSIIINSANIKWAESASAKRNLFIQVSFSRAVHVYLVVYDSNEIKMV